MSDDRNRDARDVGTDSPASESAKEQSAAGDRGGARAARQQGTGKQPPQTSGRRDPAHEHPPTQRKSFDASSDPNRQGDAEGSPSPEQLRDRQSQQGFRAQGAGSGKPRSQGDTKEAEAQAGEPQGRHTRQGRQSVPGDRDPAQPD